MIRTFRYSMISITRQRLDPQVSSDFSTVTKVLEGDPGLVGSSRAGNVRIVLTSATRIPPGCSIVRIFYKHLLYLKTYSHLWCYHWRAFGIGIFGLAFATVLQQRLGDTIRSMSCLSY